MRVLMNHVCVTAVGAYGKTIGSPEASYFRMKEEQGYGNRYGTRLKSRRPNVKEGINRVRGEEVREIGKG